MADSDTRGYDQTHDEGCSRQRRRRSFDPITLVAGILALLTSAYVLSDGPSWLAGFDLRWVLAGGAVLAGVLMLGASIRRGHD